MKSIRKYIVSINIIQLLQTILFILVVLAVGTYIVSTMIETSKTEIFECTEYKDVKFKYVGSGGLFGSIRQMETRSDDYDGWMEKCVIGNNLFGEEITRRNSINRKVFKG